MITKYAIEFQNIAKQFGDCVANRDVTFKVEAGSIHGIIGENGAGKSTAMKILFGLYQADRGLLKVFGNEENFPSAIEAMNKGIGMVHQHFMLAEPFSALDNILLHDHSGSAFGRLPRSSSEKKLQALANKYGFIINWKLPVEKLSVGEQQRIEILKVLSRESKILILDEPTAVLTPQEVKDFFINVRKLKAEGRTILIITHKLKEVMDLTDSITVFRSGKVVAERKTKETSLEELAELMVGKSVSIGHRFPRTTNLSAVTFGSDTNPAATSETNFETNTATTTRENILSVKNLSVPDRLMPLSKLNFSIRPGEILGIAGVEGNGQDILIKALLNPKSLLGISGEIKINGVNSLDSETGSQLSAKSIRDLKVGAFPEDRLRVGVLPARPVFENFLLGHQHDSEFKSGAFINETHLRNELQSCIEKFDIRPGNQDMPFEKMSGGNQQKLVAARELWHAPKFLIAAQPTRGVDIGAVEFIHSQIIAARDKGTGVLLISSELDEVLRLSDRVMVLFKGQLIAEFKNFPFPEAKIGAAMGGKELL